jgi:hypothetical protein
MKKYYIYHIPGVKIGCSDKPSRRVKSQGYIDFEILEEHECIYKASDREIELQKQYGYLVDKILYWKTILSPTKEGREKSGKNHLKSGHWLKLISNVNRSEAGKKGGKIGGPKSGKIATDTGRVKIMAQLAKEKTSKAVLVYTKIGTYIGEYVSVNECARQLNLHAANIGKVCLGKLKSTGGYVFRFKNPTEGGI